MHIFYEDTHIAIAHNGEFVDARSLLGSVLTPQKQNIGYDSKELTSVWSQLWKDLGSQAVFSEVALSPIKSQRIES